MIFNDALTPLQAGGVDRLVQLLAAGPEDEIPEFAAAAVGNLAAGSHIMKDAIREVLQYSSTACPRPCVWPMASWCSMTCKFLNFFLAVGCLW